MTSDDQAGQSNSLWIARRSQGFRREAESFWNVPKWNEQIGSALDDAYQRNVPSADRSEWGSSPITRAVEAIHRELSESSLFGHLETHGYLHSITYTTRTYLELLLTHSDIRMLEPEARGRLLDPIQRIIDDNGAELTLDYDAPAPTSAKSRQDLMRRRHTRHCGRSRPSRHQRRRRCAPTYISISIQK